VRYGSLPCIGAAASPRNSAAEIAWMDGRALLSKVQRHFSRLDKTDRKLLLSVAQKLVNLCMFFAFTCENDDEN